MHDRKYSPEELTNIAKKVADEMLKNFMSILNDEIARDGSILSNNIRADGCGSSASFDCRVFDCTNSFSC
ncbi:hypothetical protein [Bacillus toyonensis]|uniref:Uncharacterized protein n=1 Tax=Bacillus toyonensis TaxID=155322 RepID=A0AB73QTP9_9BACI|nr:hypothetical protein [Bacillus toyonensis]PEI83398.1 hypothetical protein CN678_24045 [Bacillus toyonensis]